MDWKTLFTQNWSRKAGIAALTILCLTHLGTQSEPVSEKVFWYVMTTGIVGVVVQGILDFVRPRKKRKEKPCEEPSLPPSS